jgi:hypothetical protein
MEEPRGQRLPPGGRRKIYGAAIVGAVGLGLSIYAFTRRGSAVDHDAKVAVTIAAVVILLFFLGLSYAILRMVFSPHVRGVRVTLSGDDVRRGAGVDVRIEVAKPDRMAGRLEVGLVCTEYYAARVATSDGGYRRDLRQADAHADWRPFTGGSTQSERFVVPDDAPFSYRGDCISYVWRASARLPKRLRFDQAENVPLEVRP